MQIIEFIKHYWKLRRKQNYLLQTLAVKGKKRDTPELAELNALENILHPIQAKVFTYLFIVILSVLFLTGISLSFIRTTSSPVFLDVQCESVEFDTPVAIELTNELNGSMHVNGEVGLHRDWDVDFGLSTHYESPLTIDCRRPEDRIEIETLHIPANSRIRIQRINSNHLLIIEPLDTIDAIEITLRTDSAYVSFESNDQIYQETLINAKSMGTNKEFTLEFVNPEIHWYNFQADHFSYLHSHQSVIKGGEEDTTTSIIRAGIYFEELQQDTVQINYHDTLDVRYIRPTINQLAIRSNAIHIQSRGITNHILGGSLKEMNRNELDLRPSLWLWMNKTIPSELKNFILTILVSVFAFLFIRQRKNI